MKKEFIRFGLGGYRKTVGLLQLTGGFALLLAFKTQPLLGLISSLGLCLLMLLGVITRIKIKDSFYFLIPAAIYAILNGYLALYYLDYLN